MLVEFVPTQAEQRAAQVLWLKGTLMLHSDRFRETPGVIGELRGLPYSCQRTTKFEFKLPSVYSVVCGHPTTKRESCQAQTRQVPGLTVYQNGLSTL